MCQDHTSTTHTSSSRTSNTYAPSGVTPATTSANCGSRNTFDSRSLGVGDAFGQRFMRSGEYRYQVVAAGTGGLVDDMPFRVVVQDHDGEGHDDDAPMAQHDVSVRHDGRQLVAEPAELTVREGDLVVWSCPDPRSVGFEVLGDKAFLSSGRMTNECGYSHAFGVPGEYHWVDAHGSGTRGVVRVRAVRCETAADIRQWREQLSQGTLVMIHDGKADPAEVEIVTGQTVFFAVVKGPGVSVTDRALLPAHVR
jgi:plastocyanin